MEGLSPGRPHLGPDADRLPTWVPRELRALLNLSYALHMVRRLPPFASDDAIPELSQLVREACRDALFTHSRQVADFFWTLSPDTDNATLFLPSWTPPRHVAVRLRERRRQAMAFAAPLSHENDSTADPRETDLSLVALAAIGDDCDAAVGAFVDACVAADIELLPEVRTLLDLTES